MGPILLVRIQWACRRLPVAECDFDICTTFSETRALSLFLPPPLSLTLSAAAAAVPAVLRSPSAQRARYVPLPCVGLWRTPFRFPSARVVQPASACLPMPDKLATFHFVTCPASRGAFKS